MSEAIQVLFGTETGNAEYCGERLVEAIEEAGLEAELVDMDDFEPESIAQETLVFIVTSTSGNGDPPPNAADLLDYLRDNTMDLSALKYAVCALGDRSFPYFAQCGKDFDSALKALGAQAVIERVECDDDFEPGYQTFQTSVLKYLASQS